MRYPGSDLGHLGVISCSQEASSCAHAHRVHLGREATILGSRVDVSLSVSWFLGEAAHPRSCLRVSSHLVAQLTSPRGLSQLWMGADSRGSRRHLDTGCPLVQPVVAHPVYRLLRQLANSITAALTHRPAAAQFCTGRDNSIPLLDLLVSCGASVSSHARRLPLA